MGTRLAHLVHGHRMLDHIEFDDGVTVLGVKRPGEDFTYATADSAVQPGDVLVVSGKIVKIEAFARLP